MLPEFKSYQLLLWYPGSRPTLVDVIPESTIKTVRFEEPRAATFHLTVAPPNQDIGDAILLPGEWDYHSAWRAYMERDNELETDGKPASSIIPGVRIKAGGPVQLPAIPGLAKCTLVSNSVGRHVVSVSGEHELRLQLGGLSELNGSTSIGNDEPGETTRILVSRLFRPEGDKQTVRVMMYGRLIRIRPDGSFVAKYIEVGEYGLMPVRVDGHRVLGPVADFGPVPKAIRIQAQGVYEVQIE